MGLAVIALFALPIIGCGGKPERRGGITKREAKRQALDSGSVPGCPRPTRVSCRPAPRGWRCETLFPGGGGSETTVPQGPVGITVVC